MLHCVRIDGGDQKLSQYLITEYDIGKISTVDKL